MRNILVYCATGILVVTLEVKASTLERRNNQQECTDVGIDGVRAQIEDMREVVARIRDLVPSCLSSHCVLQREVLVLNMMQVHLKNVHHHECCFKTEEYAKF
jgi:hypothetical protein